MRVVNDTYQHIRENQIVTFFQTLDHFLDHKVAVRDGPYNSCTPRWRLESLVVGIMCRIYHSPLIRRDPANLELSLKRWQFDECSALFPQAHRGTFC